MQPIIYKINLDLHESNSQYILKLSRGDVGGEIRATFNEAGKTYSLENCTCKFSALKGDGNYIYNDCTVNTESNYVSYIITDQTSAACGVAKCQLIVIGNDGKIKAAPKFEIVIDDKVYDEQEIIDSTSEFNTITSLQASVSANTSDISSLQNDVSNNSSNISILQTEIQGTGTSIALSINSSTYVMTLQLKNSNGDTISTGTIDLPLETMVVGASYNNTNKSIILTLQNGNTVSFSVADLVSGLVSESELNTLQSIVNTNVDNITNLQSSVSALDEDKANWDEVYTVEEAEDMFMIKHLYHWGTGLVTSTNMYGTTISVDMDSELATKQNIADSTLNTTNKTIPTAINEVNSIAKGANQALSYSNYNTMITAFNALENNVYNVGQNVMIVTLEVPDLWISGIEQTSSAYTYVDDETFVNALKTNGYVQVGYYKLSALETQKVDLTNYVTNTDYATSNVAGVSKGSSTYGITYDNAGYAVINKASDSEIDEKISQYKPIVPYNLDYAVKSTISSSIVKNELTSQGFIKNTNYATSSIGGTVKASLSYGISVIPTGHLVSIAKTYQEYESSSSSLFISKGTLGNVLTGKNLETANNKVTSISNTSTNTEYPSAKAVYDYIQSLNGNGVNY